MFDDFIDDIDYRVVINHEEQYSIWPKGRQLPKGWAGVDVPEVKGFTADAPAPTGSKAECLRYIQEVWTDMRPLSFHTEMAAELRREP